MKHVLAPNWRSPIRWSQKFRTEVLETRDGTEQRIALRSLPEIEWDYGVSVWKERFHDLRRFLVSNQGSKVFVPHPIKSLPLLEVLPEEKESGKQLVSDVAEYSVKLQQLDRKNEDVDAAFVPVQFEGLDVFDFKPNYVSGLNVEDIARRELVEFGRGSLRLYRPIEYHTRNQRLQFLSRSAEEARRIASFFFRAKGRQREFYAPTWQHDIAMTGVSLPGSYIISVAGTDFASTYAQTTVFTAIQIRYANDFVSRHTIQKIEVAGSNSDIYLDQPIPLALTAQSAPTISWMPRSRFSSDRMTVEWLTNGVARIVADTMTLSRSPLGGSDEQVSGYGLNYGNAYGGL